MADVVLSFILLPFLFFLSSPRYWTDNGAYYYGDAYGHNLTKMASPHANMEEVSLAVKAGLDDQNVPVKYWQWDDWWYPGYEYRLARFFFLFFLPNLDFNLLWD